MSRSLLNLLLVASSAYTFSLLHRLPCCSNGKINSHSVYSMIRVWNKPSLKATRSCSSCLHAEAVDSTIFAGVRFRDPIAKSLRALQIHEPSPIQQAAVAPLTAGMSAILHASTGSGKTLAFALPILKRLVDDKSSLNRPFQSLILVPTKELAVQVY